MRCCLSMLILLSLGACHSPSGMFTSGQDSAAVYYQSGTLSLKERRFSDAISAFHQAERWHYDTLYDVMFGLAYAYAELDSEGNNDAQVWHYMEVALQMGYPYPQRFRTEHPFTDRVRDGDTFHKAFDLAMDTRKNLNQGKFQAYLRKFPAVSLPLVVDEQWRQTLKIHMADGIDEDYYEFVPNIYVREFSRMYNPEYFYVARIKEDSNFTALLTAATPIRLWYSDTSAEVDQRLIIDNVSFYLTTYTHDGKIINHMFMGGSVSGDSTFREFSINPTGDFYIQDLKYNHYFDQLKNPSKHLIGRGPQVHFRLGPGGVITRTSAVIIRD